MCLLHYNLNLVIHISKATGTPELKFKLLHLNLKSDEAIKTKEPSEKWANANEKCIS